MADETFSSDWLALREPADHRSRSTDLIAPLAEWWAARTGRHVLDLGSGTGSNLRYLAPRLPGEQAWTLVDRDAALLDRATSAGVTSPGVGRVEPDSETVPEGLGSGTVPGRSGSGAVPRGHDSGTVPTGVGSEVVALECVVGELDPEGLVRVPEADLVTASALLDLVTHQWLERLVEACRAAGNAALLSLTWDGTMTWGHPDRNDHPAADAEKPADGLVAEAVRDHQLRDKGMGPALGPAAGPALRHLALVKPVAPGCRRRAAGSSADRWVGGRRIGGAPCRCSAHPGLGRASPSVDLNWVHARGGARGPAGSPTWARRWVIPILSTIPKGRGGPKPREDPKRPETLERGESPGAP